MTSESLINFLNNWKDIITTLVVIVSAITTIVVTTRKFDKKMNELKEWQETTDEHNHDNYLNILRLTIMSEEMPLEERILAGDKYIKAGGNGAVKHYYNELIENLPPISTRVV